MINRDTDFHKKQEELTELIYQTPNMLPSRYVFVLTNLCNLRCDFCFQKKKPRANAMTSEDWINFSKQIPEYARITLTGGEPLIFKGFKNVFNEVAEKFDCNIISNGTLLNRETTDFILSYSKFKIFSVSIDDIGNKVRNVSPKQWDNLTENLKYFIDKRNVIGSDCKLDIKTTVLDDNANNLFNIYTQLIETLNPDTYSFQFLKGSPIQHSDVMFSFKDIQESIRVEQYKDISTIRNQLKKVRKYNLETGRVAFVHPKILDLNSEEELPDLTYFNREQHRSSDYSPCKFPWSSVHINYDGNLFPCLAVSMGNVKEKSLREIIEGEKMQKFRGMIKENKTLESCSRCGWLRQR